MSGEAGIGKSRLVAALRNEAKTSVCDDPHLLSLSLSRLDERAIPQLVDAIWRPRGLLGETCRPVPLAVVDTVYTVPSPHPAIFPRTTTGLGAGTNLTRGIVHAGLEILERDAVARAHAMPHFFDRRRIKPPLRCSVQ